MRRRHFETYSPVCPVCRTSGKAWPLRVAQVAREGKGDILEGILHCTNEECLREFPIIDGVPLIVADIRKYVSENILAVNSRRDLGQELVSLIGDCCGPGSSFDQVRQQLSTYVWDHYGDLDPKEPDSAQGGTASQPRPGSVVDVLASGLKLAGTRPAGPILDVGCSVGRTTFALAQESGELVLGVDLHFPMLRLASEVLRQGMMKYSRRRTGLVYEQREFAAQFPNSENVDFWACDAAALPLAQGRIGLAVNLNLLDCVYAPRELMVSLANVLKTGARLVMSCPYDWSASATPIEGWIGGHSQRSDLAGSPEAVLRKLLTPGANVSSINSLKLIAESEAPTWNVRLHERSLMAYQGHLVVAEKLG